MKQSLEEAQETLAAERRQNLDRFLLLHQNKMAIHFGTLTVATGGWSAVVVGVSQIGGAAHSEWTGQEQQGLITQATSSSLQAGGVEQVTADLAGQITEFGIGVAPAGISAAKMLRAPKSPKFPQRYSQDPVTFENVADDLAKNKPSVKNAPEVKPAESVPDAKVVAPNRPLGGRGPNSGREFDPSKAGGPIRQLSTDKIKITDRGIDFVERHLERFGPDPANQAMVQRLRDIASGKIKPTQTDLNFYSHELRESIRYKKLGFPSGQPESVDEAYDLWNNAHTGTLEDYRLREGPGVLYHPSANP